MFNVTPLENWGDAPPPGKLEAVWGNQREWVTSSTFSDFCNFACGGIE